MPAVGAFIAAAVSTAVGKFVATMALSLALGAYQQSRARKKAREAEQAQRDAYNRSLKDRHVTIRSGVSTRKYVLGTVRVGGTLMHIEANGTHNTALDSVLAMAGNKCELEGYYVGDEYLPVGQFPGDRWGSQKQLDLTSSHPVGAGSGTVSTQLGAMPVAGSVVAKGDTTKVGAAGARVTATRINGDLVEVDYVSVGAGTVHIAYKTLSGEKMRVLYKDGDPNQTVTNWGDISTPMWTADHRLRGVAYLRTLNLWDEDLYHAGAPQMGAVLKGGPVDGHSFFDPRTTTYLAHTTNPALLAAWYMTLPRNKGGMGIPESWIDWPTVSNAANICDEMITVRMLEGDGYESIKRYECNTLLDTANPPVENLNIIMSSMAGDYVFTAGMYRVFAGAFRPAVITITDDDVSGEKDIVMDKSGQEDAPANIVTSSFVNANRNFLESSPRPIRNPAYVAADGAESPLDMPLPATTDERQASYLMGVALESARPAFAGELVVLGIGEDIAVMDTIQLNLSNRPEYAGRTFQVVNRIDHWDGTFTLSLLETRANVWSLDPDTFLPTDPSPVADTSYLWNIAPVTNFQVNAQKPQALADGTAVVRVDLSWNLHPQPYVRQGGRIEVRYRPSGGEWIWAPPAGGDSTGTSITAALLDGQPYQFQARAVSSIGASSNWTDGWVDYDGVVGAPPALTSLSVTGIVMGMEAVWTFPGTRNKLRHTEIRYSLDNNFVNAILLGEFAWPTDRHTLMGLAYTTRFWFWARLVDENGTPGPWYPSEAGAGVMGDTVQDPAVLETWLNGLINESMLAPGLIEGITEDVAEGLLDEITGELSGDDVLDEVWFAGDDDEQGVFVGTVTTTSAYNEGDYYQAKRTTSLIAQVDQSLAIIREVQTVQANQTMALASSITTLAADVGSVESAVQITSQALASLRGGAEASWGVMVEARSDGRRVQTGVAAGAAIGENGQSRSELIFMANTVAFTTSLNGQLHAPFVFDVANDTAFLNTVFIQNATISFLKLMNDLESVNFMNNFSGWRIDKNGNIQINGSGGGGRLSIRNDGIRMYYPSGSLAMEMVL